MNGSSVLSIFQEKEIKSYINDVVSIISTKIAKIYLSLNFLMLSRFDSRSCYKKYDLNLQIKNPQNEPLTCKVAVASYEVF